MVQHLLLAMVAPPLLALGAPVLLVLRVSRPAFRSAVLLPILHSRLVRVGASPLVAWILLSVVMWATHFTPIYEAALENEPVHVLEHLTFLVTGCLFWWPVVGADPMPRRLRFGPRVAYLVAQMPVNAAVGLAIYFAPSVLYAHYVVAAPLRRIDPMADQQIGGLLMWAVGDLLLLGAVALLVSAWMRADARRSALRRPARTSPGAG
jgi:putative copper resistance protein D